MKSGVNPLAVKREAEALAKTPSFEALARRHIAENSDSWRNAKHRAQWLSSLATYVFPSLGSTRVDEISRRDVIDTLSPIWISKPETARRVRQRRSPTSFTQTQNSYRAPSTGCRPLRWGKLPPVDISWEDGSGLPIGVAGMDEDNVAC